MRGGPKETLEDLFHEPSANSRSTSRRQGYRIWLSSFGMHSSFHPARFSLVVSNPLLWSRRATSRARRRMTAIFAGSLSARALAPGRWAHRVILHTGRMSLMGLGGV